MWSHTLSPGGTRLPLLLANRCVSERLMRTWLDQDNRPCDIHLLAYQLPADRSAAEVSSYTLITREPENTLMVDLNISLRNKV